MREHARVDTDEHGFQENQRKDAKVLGRKEKTMFAMRLCVKSNVGKTARPPSTKPDHWPHPTEPPWHNQTRARLRGRSHFVVAKAREQTNLRRILDHMII
jgi:hypothetical protein